MLFRARLEEYLESGISQFEIEQPSLTAMLTTYRDGRWLLMFQDDQKRDRPTLEALIRRAIGRADVGIDIVSMRQVTDAVRSKSSDPIGMRAVASFSARRSQGLSMPLF